MDFHFDNALTFLGKILEKRCSTAAWVLIEGGSASAIRWVWYWPVPWWEISWKKVFGGKDKHQHLWWSYHGSCRWCGVVYVWGLGCLAAPLALEFCLWCSERKSTSRDWWSCRGAGEWVTWCPVVVVGIGVFYLELLFAFLVDWYWLVLSFQRLYGYRSPTDANCLYVLLTPVSATAIKL